MFRRCQIVMSPSAHALVFVQSTCVQRRPSVGLYTSSPRNTNLCTDCCCAAAQVREPNLCFKFRCFAPQLLQSYWNLGFSQRRCVVWSSTSSQALGAAGFKGCSFAAVHHASCESSRYCCLPLPLLHVACTLQALDSALVPTLTASSGHPTVKLWLVVGTEQLRLATPSADSLRTSVASMDLALKAGSTAPALYSAAGTLAAQLASSVALPSSLFSGLVSGVARHCDAAGAPQGVLCLAAMHSGQGRLNMWSDATSAVASAAADAEDAVAVVPELPQAAAVALLRLTALPSAVAALSDTHDASLLLSALLRAGLRACMKDGSLQPAFQSCLGRVTLSSALAGEMLRRVVEAFLGATDAQADHLGAALHLLCTAYPAATDAALHSVLHDLGSRGAGDKGAASALKWISSVLSGTSIEPVVLTAEDSGEAVSALAVSSSVSHPSAAVRARGLAVLAGMVKPAAAACTAVLQQALGSATPAAGAAHSDADSGSDTSDDDSDDGDVSLADHTPSSGGLAQADLSRLVSALCTLALARRTVAERVADDDANVASAACDLLCELHEAGHLLPPCLSYLVAALQHVAHDDVQVAKGLQIAAAADAVWLSTHTGASSTAADEGLAAGLVQASATSVARAVGAAWVGALLAALRSHVTQGSAAAGPVFRELVVRVLPAFCGPMGPLAEADGAIANAATPRSAVTHGALLDEAQAWDTTVAAAALSWWGTPSAPLGAAGVAVLEAAAAAAATGSTVAAVRLLSPGSSTARSGGGRKSKAATSASVPEDATGWTVVRGVALAALHAASGPAGVEAPELRALLVAATTAHPVHGNAAGRWVAALALTYAAQVAAGGVAADGEGQVAATPSRRRRRSRSDSMDSRASVTSTASAVGGEVALVHTPSSRDALLRVAAAVAVAVWSRVASSAAHLPTALLTSAAEAPSADAVLAAAAHGSDSGRVLRLAAAHSVGVASVLLAAAASLAAADCSDDRSTQVAAAVSTPIKLRDTVLNKHATCDRAVIVADMALAALSAPVSVLSTAGVRVLAALFRSGPVVMPSAAALCADHSNAGDAADSAAAKVCMTLARVSAPVGNATLPALQAMVTAPAAAVPPTAVTAALLVLRDCMQLLLAALAEGVPAPADGSVGDSKMALAAKRAVQAAMHDNTGILGRELPHALAMLPYLLAVLLAVETEDARAVACDALVHLSDITQHLLRTGITTELDEPGRVPLVVAATAASKLVAVRAELQSSSTAAHNALAVLLGRVSGSATKGRAAARSLAKQLAGEESDVSVATGRKRRGGRAAAAPAAAALATVAEAEEEVQDMQLSEEHATALGGALADMSVAVYGVSPAVSATVVSALQRVQPSVVWQQFLGLAVAIMGELHGAHVASVQQVTVIATALAIVRRAARQVAEGDETAPPSAMTGLVQLLLAGVQLGAVSPELPVTDGTTAEYSPLLPLPATLSVLTQGAWAAASRCEELPQELLGALGPLSGTVAAGEASLADVLLLWLSRVCSGAVAGAAGARSAQQTLLGLRLHASQVSAWMQRVGLVAATQGASAAGKTPSKMARRKSRAGGAAEDEGPSMGAVPPLLMGLCGKEYAAGAAMGHADAVVAVRHAVVLAEVLVGKLSGVASASGSSISAAPSLLQPLLVASTGLAAALRPVWLGEAELEGAAQDAASSAEFALQLLLSAAHSVVVLQAQAAAAAGQTAEPVSESVLPHLVQVALRAGTVQGRTAALRLLAALAALAPRGVLSHILPVFVAVGTSADVTRGADATSAFRALGDILDHIVPCIAAHGPAAGISLPLLLRVFASLATALPVRDVGPLLERLLSAAASAATSVDTAALKQALAGAAPSDEKSAVRITGRLRRARAAGAKANYAGALAAMLTSHAVQFAPAGAQDEDPVRGPALLSAALAGETSSAASQLADATIAQLPGRSQVQALVEMTRGIGQLLTVLRGPLAADEEEEEDADDDAAMEPAEALAFNLAAAAQDKAAFAQPPSCVGAWLPLCTHDDGTLRKLNLLQHVHELEMKAQGTQGALTVPQRLAVARARGTLGPSNLPMGDPGRQALVVGVLRAVSRMLASSDFIAATAPNQGQSAGDAAENDKQNTQFLRLADALFTGLAKCGSALEATRQAPASAARRTAMQFWTAAVECSLDALGHMSALLPVSSFVALISMLLRQASAAVRRRALVFLNERLEADVAAGISDDEAVLYVQLLQELTELLGSDSEPAPSRTTAAVSLHILAKHFAASHAEDFADCTRALVGVLLGTSATDVPVSGKRSRRGSKRARRTRETGGAGAPEEEDASVAESSVAGSGAVGDAAEAGLRASAALALSMLVEKASQLVVPHVPRVLPRLVADADQLVASVRRSATVAAAMSAGSDSESDLEAASGAVSAAGAARAAAEASVGALRHVLVALQAFAQHLPKFLSRFVPDVLKLVLGPGLVEALVTPFDTPAGASKAVPAQVDSDSAADSSDSEGEKSDDDASTAGGGSTVSGATSDAGTSVLSGAGSTLLAAAVGKVLSPADAAMSKGGIPAMAAAIREALGMQVASRVLVPHLSAVLPWAMDSSPAAAAGLLGVLKTRLTNLPRADVAPVHTAVHALVASALDYRWLRGCYAGELGSTAVESAAVGAWMALVLHLSETQLRPLLLQLTTWRGAEASDLLLAAESAGVWPAEGPSAAMEGGSLTESAGEDSGLWAFAGLCRRIAFYHTLQALTVTLKTIAVPLYDGLLPDMAAELLALATAAVAGGEKRSRGEGGAAGAGSSKRSRGADDADVGSADGSLSSQEEDLSEDDAVIDGASEGASVGTADSDSDSDSDSDGAAEDFIPGGVPPSVKNNMCARRGSPTEVSAALAWEHEARAVVHKDVKAGTVELLPSAGHTLRCLVLGCLTAAAASDSSKWFERTRLQQILVPLVAQFETPASTAAGVNQPVQGCVPVPALVSGDSPAAAAAASKLDSGVHVDAARNGYRAFVTAYCLPAVGTLVAALGDDMLWKRLNHDLLMLTRDSRARVRLAGVWGSSEVFGQGREDALVLLPETIPFLAEAMEDGDAEVEQQTNALVRRLEELSGESLQEFLTR